MQGEEKTFWKKFSPPPAPPPLSKTFNKIGLFGAMFDLKT
jgi:hypothetical protein